MRCFLFAVFLVVASATVAAADSIDDPKSAYDRGDYTRAARLFSSLVKQGEAQPQGNLGTMYAERQGVPPNAQEAVKQYCTTLFF